MTMAAWSNVPARLVRHPDLSIGAKAAALALGLFTDARFTCWPSRRTLAEILKVSPDSIDRYVAELIAAGFLRKADRYTKDGRQTSNAYAWRFDLTDEEARQLAAESEADDADGGGGEGRTGAAGGGRTGAAPMNDTRMNDTNDNNPARQKAIAFFDGVPDVPELYVGAIEGALRASGNPVALEQELAALVSGLHGPEGKAVPKLIIGRAIQEMSVGSRPMGARSLRRFCADLMQEAAAAHQGASGLRGGGGAGANQAKRPGGRSGAPGSPVTPLPRVS